MKLSLAGLKVHLSHCAMHPAIGRQLGLLFTISGSPSIVATPVKRVG